MKIVWNDLEKYSKYEQVKRKKGSANKKQENMIIRVSVPNLFLDKNTSQYKLLIYKILRCEILRYN